MNLKLNKHASALIVIAILSIGLTMAQRPIDKLKARNVLLRTNRVIGYAHMAVKRNKVYTGDLAKAIRHQRFAKRLYTNGMYLKAIHHSRRARLLATEAIKANRAKATLDSSFTPEEQQLFGDAPSDKDLDDELTKDDPKELKDEDILDGNFDIEVQ